MHRPLGRRLLAVTLAIMSGGTAWAGPSATGPREQTLRDLEYLTFASQPMVPEDQPAAAS